MIAMGFDNVYESIGEDNDDRHWAFGTGFSETLSGVEQSLPIGIDVNDLAAYCLMLGDDALVMSHRLQEWVARAPELEEETALANIALDLLGQARLLLTRAGVVAGSGMTEDTYAFFRDENEFLNVRLAELTDADFGALMARLFVFSSWRLAILKRLRASKDQVVAAVASKGAKEITYHRDYAAQWVVRLADGTDESRSRIVAGLCALSPFISELFTASAVEQRMLYAGVAADLADVRTEVVGVLLEVFSEVELEPQVLGAGYCALSARGGLGGELDSIRSQMMGEHGSGSGREGIHTKAMVELLGDLQSLARSYPGATW